MHTYRAYEVTDLIWWTEKQTDEQMDALKYRSSRKVIKIWYKCSFIVYWHANMLGCRLKKERNGMGCINLICWFMYFMVYWHANMRERKRERFKTYCESRCGLIINDVYEYEYYPLL